MTPLTKEQENRKMLAALLGIKDEEASQRLEVMVLVTHDANNASAQMALQIAAMLERTVRASTATSASEHAVVEVIVGAAKPRTRRATVVWVGSVADGILVSTRQFTVGLTAQHAIFGLIAACYASALALRFALRRDLPFSGDDTILISPKQLLGDDLPFINIPCELGEAVLAGAGAVGNAFLYGLQNFRVIGRLHIVDPKSVHDGILNRCIWFTETDLGEPKAPAIANRARTAFPNLELIPHISTIKEFYTQDGAPALRRLITTVDSRRARRALQGEIPREVFDASTTGIAEIVLHFNEQPSELACLSCIYRQESGEIAHELHVAEALGVSVEQVRQGFISKHAAEAICASAPDLRPEDLIGKAYDTLFKARCAEGKLRTAEERQVLAPFCVVSMLAGAYLALELVRRVNSGFGPQPFNYWRLSPWHAPVMALRALRERLPGCDFCGEPTTREIARELWGA